MDKNNLGSFNSLQELWEAHPEGGHEGDYATVNGVVFRWNKYNRIWSGTGTPMETYGRKTYIHEGDVVINNDLTVAGMIRARGVKQPNKGLFHDLASLQKRYPFPEVGWWATVGDSVPGQIYRCDQPGVWSATGETGGLDSVDYEKINKIEQLLQEGYTFMGVATSETNPGIPDQKVFYIAATGGTYKNMGGYVVDNDSVAILSYADNWVKIDTNIANNNSVNSVLQKLGYAFNVTKAITMANFEFYFPVVAKAGTTLEITLSADDVLSTTEYVPLYANNTSGAILATITNGKTVDITLQNDITNISLFARSAAFIAAGNATLVIVTKSGFTQTINKNLSDTIIAQDLILSDGKTMANNTNLNYLHSTYLLAVPGLVVRNAYSFANTDYIYAWFYDAQYNVVGNLSGIRDGQYELALNQSNIPTGAKYVRFNAMYDSLNEIQHAIPTDYGTLDTRIKTLDTRIKTLDTRIKTLEIDKVDVDESMIFNGKEIANNNQSQWGWVTGLCASKNGTINMSFGDSFKYNTVLIPILPNTKYRLGHRESSEMEYFYDINGNFLQAIKVQTNSTTEIEFTTPEDAYFIRFSYYINVNVSLNYNGTFSTTQIEEIEKKLALIPQPDAIETLPAPVLYGRVNSASGAYMNFNNSIYAEGFVKQINDCLTINGGREFMPNGVGKTGTFTENVLLENTSGSKKTIQVTIKNVNPSSVSGNARILCIGESTTAASEKDPYKGNVGPWGWPSTLRYLSIIDRADNVGIDVLTLGTRNGNSSRSFVYKNNTYSIRSCHEGHSGWSAFSMLNFPTIAKFSPSATRFYPRTIWYALGLCSKTPYSQSDYNTNVEEFTGTAAQYTLMTQTPWGKYKIDFDVELWSLMQKMSGSVVDGRAHPIFADLTSPYTGSTAQKNMMQNWYDALSETPVNPFFSIDEARTGSSGTAFSLTKYLQRFRTMDDAGNRLSGTAGQTVDGDDGNTYTIGTDVINTNDYDVCMPTHVILNIGINDSEGANTPANTIETIKTFVGCFNVPVAYFLTRYPGVMNRGAWTDFALPSQYTFLVHNIGVLDDITDWFGKQQNKYLIGSYLIQNPCSVTGNFVEDDTINHVQRLNCTNNNVHPGIIAYKTIGFQCLCWLYYVQSL